MKIVVTGARGFIAQNLLAHLRFQNLGEIVTVTREDDEQSITAKLKDADCVFHLAGVNRPKDQAEFETGNVQLTALLINVLEQEQRPYKFIYSSSAQAQLNNPYGESKRKAEDDIAATIKNGTAYIYRLPGVFGKWCRPNYNSVVATFCYNIARDLPVTVSDPNNQLRLVYVDDVVRHLVSSMTAGEGRPGKVTFEEAEPVHELSLGTLLKTIEQFRESRKSLVLPEIGDPLIKKLYTTWLSYLPEDNFSYGLELKTDNRGWLFELLKTHGAGQIFLSKTHPGITRGNHFHHTKTEKFVVIEGEGLIRFRKITGDDERVIEYKVSGAQPTVVDIPPGYTHSITNTGSGEMITLFWANEIFDPARPDTYFLTV